MAGRREWSQLPEDLLTKIAKNLDTHFDFLHFHAVCHSWRSSAVSLSNLTLTTPYPIVPSPFFPEEEKQDVAPLLCSLVENTIYVLQPRECDDQLHRIESSSSSSSSSSKCWLIKVQETKPNMLKLLNPLSRNPLPSFPQTLPKNCKIHSLGKHYRLVRTKPEPNPNTDHIEYLLSFLVFKRVVLSPDSTMDDFAFMTITSYGELILLRSRDETWTVVGEPKPPFQDVIHHKGHFHAINSSGKTYLVDTHTSSLTLVADHFLHCGGTMRFVESNGELFLLHFFYIDSLNSHGTLHWSNIVRFHQCLEKLHGTQTQDNNQTLPPSEQFSTYEPIACKVFKLDEAKLEWVQVESLGDRIFFVGDGLSFSMAASDSLTGCKGNSILFADFCFMTDFKFMEYNQALSQDIVVFNLEDGSFGKLEKYPGYLQLFWPPPNWFAPQVSH